MQRFKKVSLVLAITTGVVVQSLAAAPDGWQQLNGPLGGIVTRIVDASDAPLAALYSGGIYSLDGNTWEQSGIFNGLPENRTFDMVVDPTNSDNIYVTQMIGCGAHSVDRGVSWTSWCDALVADIAVDNYSSEAIMLDSADPNIIYFAGHDHNNVATFIRTTSSATDFEILATFTEAMNFNSLIEYHDVFYLATREHGIWLSSDHGITWTQFNTGLEDLQTMRFVVDEEDDVLYINTGLMQYNVRTGGTLYRLSADGTAWQTVADAPALVTGLAISQGRLWVGTENGQLYREKMSGQFTLQNSSHDLPGLVGEILAIDGTLYLGVGGYGIYRSLDNGKTIIPFNKNLKAIATRDVFVHPTQTDNVYVITWDRPGVYRTTNGGGSFQILGADKYVTAFAVNPQAFREFYAGGNQFYDVTVKKNGSSTWTERAMPSMETDATLEALVVDPNNSDHVLAGVGIALESQPGYGLYYSYNSGDDWKRAKGIPKRKSVTSIVMHPTKPNIVYAASFGRGVYKSSNGGRTFVQVGSSDLQYTFRLAMSAGDPRVLVAGSNLFFAGFSTADQISGEYGGLFQSRDAGKTWTEITASVRNYDDPTDDFELWKYNFGHLPNYERILIHPDNPDVVIVGHHGESVVLTSDGGETWEKQAAGMIPGNMHNYAYCLGANENFSKIYTCTCGRGLFAGQLSSNNEIAAYTAVRGTALPHNAAEARATLLSETHLHAH